MPFIGPRHVLYTNEVAKYLGGRCTTGTVVCLIKKGLLEGKKLGYRWLLLPDWLEKYMTKPDNVVSSTVAEKSRLVPNEQLCKFLTPAEAAQYLGAGTTRGTVTSLICQGKLKGKKIGGGWRILPEWLDEFMSQPDEISKK